MRNRSMAQRHATIGVDIGTSGCKAVVLGENRRVIASAQQRYPTCRRSDGTVTQDANDWLRAARGVLRACVDGCPGVAVEALALTAPAHDAVLVDHAGHPLAPTLLAFDARPTAVATALRAAYGIGFFEQTFAQLTAAWTLPQLVWLRRTRPDLWSRVRLVLVRKDFVRYRLTGTIATDPSDAAGTAMYSPRSGRWLEALCADAALRPDQLPPIRPAREIAGSLTAKWARYTGLKAGTPVIVGGTDTATELVSVGATAPGSALVKIASTGTVVTVTADPQPEPRLLTYPHVVDGRWYSLTVTNAAAAAYQWLREAFFSAIAAESPLPYAAMDRLASRVRPGADGVLFIPFLDGERSPFWDPDLRAAFLGLSSAHRQHQICRAVLEGVAFALRSCRDLLQELGLAIRQPFLGGGGMASRLWRTILVTVLGQPAYLAEPQGPAVGSALLAASAVGMLPHTDLPLARPAPRMISPRQDWQEVYERLFAMYLEAAVGISGISHRLVAESRSGGTNACHRSHQ